MSHLMDAPVWVLILIAFSFESGRRSDSIFARVLSAIPTSREKSGWAISIMLRSTAIGWRNDDRLISSYMTDIWRMTERNARIFTGHPHTLRHIIPSR